VASLRARSPLRSAHPLLLFVNKIVSLTAFIILLCVGWVVLSYLKSDIIDRWRTGQPDSVLASRSVIVPRESAVPETKPLISTVRLVYSCSGDKASYHSLSHLPARCQRTALSEQAAIQQGLKRCGKCFPD